MGKIMKIVNKIICLILSFTFLIVAGSCGKEDETNAGIPNIKEFEYSGVHEFSAKETDDYLVKDGKTEYTLVYPSYDNYLFQYDVARKEFVKFFGEATGITISAVMDNGLVWNEEKKYISLGENSLTEQADIDVNEIDLKVRGTRIVTKGKTIFIYGNTPEGAINGVYDFMQMEFNFDVYYADNYELDVGVKNIKLKNYNVIDIPDIKEVNYGQTFQNVSWNNHKDTDSLYAGYRTRMSSSLAKAMLPARTPNGGWHNLIHNTFDFLPKEVYMASHPKWYSLDSVPVSGELEKQPNYVGQLCFTARGDENELKLMKEEMANRIKDSLKADPPSSKPYANMIGITINDGGYCCKCESCIRTARKYTSESTPPTGSEQAAVIMFVNDVAEIVDAWMETEEGKEYKRDLKYYIFAYQAYNNCPAKYNEELDKYEPIDEDVRFNDNVGVWYCGPGCNGGLYQDTPAAKNKRNQLQMWSDMTNSMIVYSYSGSYDDIFEFRDFINIYDSDFFKAMQSVNCDFYFDDNIGGNYISPSFSILKEYLFGKLTWNADQDIEELTLKFFKAMYKDGWQEMYQMYQSLRLNLAVKSENGLIDLPRDKSTFPEQLVNSWFNLCETARQKVEKYKTSDLNTYNRIMNYIDIEWMLPAHWTFKFYSSSFNSSELMEMQRKFKKIGLANGIYYLDNYKVSLESYTSNFPD